jgi:hypothetical protein
MIVRRNLDDPDSCYNCGERIGRLETPHLWKEHIVCARCRQRLEDDSARSAPSLAIAPPSLPTPQDDFRSGEVIAYANLANENSVQTPRAKKSGVSRIADAIMLVLGIVCILVAVVLGSQGEGSGAIISGIIGALLILFLILIRAGSNARLVSASNASSVSALMARGPHIICPNPSCGYVGPGRKIPKGSLTAGCLLMFFFLLPGLLYLMFTSGYHIVCPRCGLQIRDE